MEFVGGGWVQNDEAVTDYQAIVDQMTEGHRFLLNLFGQRVHVTYQIDPFGATDTYGMLSALMGVDAHVMDRIPLPTQVQFEKHKKMQFVWKTSQTLGDRTMMMSHVMDQLYGSPIGFDFDAGGPLNPPTTPQNVDLRSALLCTQILVRTSLSCLSCLL